MLRNGARKVYAAPVRTAEDYELAFALLGEKEDVSVVVCDSTALAVQQALKASLETCAQRRRELMLRPFSARDTLHRRSRR